MREHGRTGPKEPTAIELSCLKSNQRHKIALACVVVLLFVAKT